MVLDFSGAKRLEMECQILTMALRQSWSSRDPVGAVNAAGILNEIFPDLVSEYTSNPTPSDLYNFLELNPDAGPLVIRKAYHYAIRRFLRENKGSALRRKRTDFFRVLDAGIIMRKSRLRLSHDLAVLRSQLISNRIIGPEGNFVLAGRTKDETRAASEIPEVLEKLIERKVIGNQEAKAILNQMVLFPNISCRDLIISAGYLTGDELDIIIEATQSEATGQFEKLKLTNPAPSVLPSPLPLVASTDQWAAAAAGAPPVHEGNLSQPANRQVQSTSQPLSAPRGPGQDRLSAPKPPAAQDKPLAAPRPPTKEVPLAAPRPPSQEMARDVAQQQVHEGAQLQEGAGSTDESLASALSPGLLAKAMAASQPPDSLGAALSPEVLKRALIESQAQTVPPQARQQEASSPVPGEQAAQPDMYTGDSTAGQARYEEPPVDDSRNKWGPQPDPAGPVDPASSFAEPQSEPGAPPKEALFSSPFEIWEMPRSEASKEELPAPSTSAVATANEPFSSLIKPEEAPPSEPLAEPSKLFVSDESVAEYTPKSAFSSPPAVEPPPVETEPAVSEVKPQLAPHQRFPEPDEPDVAKPDASGIIVDATPLKVPVPPQLEFSAGGAPAKTESQPAGSSLSDIEKLKKFLDDEAKVKEARARIREREAAQYAQMDQQWQPASPQVPAQTVSESMAQPPEVAPAPQPVADEEDSDSDDYEDDLTRASPPVMALKDLSNLPSVKPSSSSTPGAGESRGMPLLDWGEPEELPNDTPIQEAEAEQEMPAKEASPRTEPSPLFVEQVPQVHETPAPQSSVASPIDPGSADELWPLDEEPVGEPPPPETAEPPALGGPTETSPPIAPPALAVDPNAMPSDSIISKPSFLTPPPSFLSQPPSFLTPPASMRGKKAEMEAAKSESNYSLEPVTHAAQDSETTGEAGLSGVAQRIEKRKTGLDAENNLALNLMMLAGLVTGEQAESLEARILSGESDSVYTLSVSLGLATSTEIAIVRRAEDLLTALSQDRKEGA